MGPGDLPEYRQRLARIPMALNVADLRGHSPLRFGSSGRWHGSGAPTADGIATMASPLEPALLAPFGLSTSLFDRDAEQRPVPSALSDERALAALIEVLGRHCKVLEFIPEIRSEKFPGDVDRFAGLSGPRCSAHVQRHLV